jgi:hypothetical protein
VHTDYDQPHRGGCACPHCHAMQGPHSATLCAMPLVTIRPRLRMCQSRRPSYVAGTLLLGNRLHASIAKVPHTQQCSGAAASELRHVFETTAHHALPAWCTAASYFHAYILTACQRLLWSAMVCTVSALHSAMVSWSDSCVGVGVLCLSQDAGDLHTRGI